MGHARFYDERRAEGVEFAKLLLFVVNIWTHLPYRVTKLFTLMDTFQAYMWKIPSFLKPGGAMTHPPFSSPLPPPLFKGQSTDKKSLLLLPPTPPQVCNYSSEPQQPIKACSPILGEQRHRSTF